MNFHKSVSAAGKRSSCSVVTILLLALLGGFTVEEVLSQTCIQPPSDLVSWWDGDAVSGTTATDIQGGGNDAALVNGATTASGLVGQAFSLDGVDDRVEVQNAANLNFGTGTSFTVDLWFKTSGPIGAGIEPTLVDKRKEDGDGFVIFISQGFVAAGLNGPTFGLGNPSTALDVISLSPLVDGQWHHVAMVVSRTTQTLQMFIDAVDQGPAVLTDGVSFSIPNSPVPANASFTNSARLLIGHQTIDFGPGFATGLDPYSGLIDEVEIFNRALSASEIQAIFDAGSAGKCKGVPVIALDHFKCYEAKGEPVNVTVDLEDQFGVEPRVLVGKPRLFCNPVSKNAERINNPTAHLTCYEIEEEGEERAVRVENQFGEQTLRVAKPDLLCVPSQKIEVLPIVEISLSIDIKPSSFPNSINRKSRGNVPVALLSSPTFDATTADRSTVKFAGASPLAIGKTPEDVNGDGLLDVVFHFATQSLSLPDGTTEACLTGKTTGGTDFKGCDSVKLVQ